MAAGQLIAQPLGSLFQYCKGSPLIMAGHKTTCLLVDCATFAIRRAPCSVFVVGWSCSLLFCGPADRSPAKAPSRSLVPTRTSPLTSTTPVRKKAIKRAQAKALQYKSPDQSHCRKLTALFTGQFFTPFSTKTERHRRAAKTLLAECMRGLGVCCMAAAHLCYTNYLSCSDRGLYYETIACSVRYAVGCGMVYFRRKSERFLGLWENKAKLRRTLTASCRAGDKWACQALFGLYDRAFRLSTGKSRQVLGHQFLTVARLAAKSGACKALLQYATALRQVRGKGSEKQRLSILKKLCDVQKLQCHRGWIGKACDRATQLTPKTERGEYSHFRRVCRGCVYGHPRSCNWFDVLCWKAKKRSARKKACRRVYESRRGHTWRPIPRRVFEQRARLCDNPAGGTQRGLQ